MSARREFYPGRFDAQPIRIGDATGCYE
jgi:hypothetical protein